MTSWICTKRLLLERANSPSIEYASKMVRWLNDPDVVKFSEQRHKIHSTSNQLIYIHSFVWPNQFRLIMLNNELIGTMTAYVDTNNSVADIGILIDKDQWGHGYGLEAWIGLMEHLFGMGVHKIEAGCMSPNAPMIQIFQKSGMTREGYRDSHFSFGKGRADLEQWSKFKDG